MASGPGSTIPSEIFNCWPVKSTFALANGVTLLNVRFNCWPVTEVITESPSEPQSYIPQPRLPHPELISAKTVTLFKDKFNRWPVTIASGSASALPCEIFNCWPVGNIIASPKAWALFKEVFKCKPVTLINEIASTVI